MAAIEAASFSHPWTLAQFQAELAQPHSRTLAAMLEFPTAVVVAGYLVFWLLPEELHILNLAVAPQWRRRGIGRRLLAAALDCGRRAKAQTAWLEVRPSNQPALALYHSFGFRQVMIRKGYYSDSGEDALILRLTLIDVSG